VIAVATRPKILFLEGNVDGTVGGSYYSLLFLLQGLDKSRFDPVVVFRRDTPIRPKFEATGADVRIVPRPQPFKIEARNSPFGKRHPVIVAPLAVVQSAINFVRFCWNVVGLCRLLRRERIDLVHLNNSITSNHDWMVAAWLTGRRRVSHERGINPRHTRMARWVSARLDAILCISEAVRANLRSQNIGGDRLFLIHNGLDPNSVAISEQPEAVRARYGIAGARRIIGMVGNIRAWKGQEVIIRALPAILTQAPDVVCMFVGAASGSDDAYSRRLHALIEELGIGSSVIFTGYCANVADVVNLMDVVLHASILPEPFGRVLLEAMALRKPLVASRGGAVTEIVEDGVTGFTFEPGNSPALAECVGQLLADPERAKAMGAAGYERLAEHFSLTKNVQQTTNVYQRLFDATA
jgi:glycosyltransferase involved in cell wall biosynthesis